jgi:hypothetical protein
MKDFLKKINKWLWNESVSSGKKEEMFKSGIKKIDNMKRDIKRKIIKEKKVKPWYPFKTRYPKDPKEKEARVFEVKDTKTIEKKPIKYRSK